MYNLSFDKSGKEQCARFGWEEFSLRAFLVVAVAEEQTTAVTDMLYTPGMFSGDRKASHFTCPLRKESLSMLTWRTIRTFST